MVVISKSYLQPSMKELSILALYIIFYALSNTALAQVELLQNPDFEEAFDGTNNWWCNNCQLDHNPDSYTGQYSGKISNRNYNWAGLSQYVDVKPNKKYYFNCTIKYINQLDGYQWHQVDLLLQIEYPDGTSFYQWFARIPHMEVSHGWQIHGGDFIIGSKAISRVRLYFQVTEPSVMYLVDSASLKEILDNPNWKEEANARIEQIRKADIILATNISNSYNPSDITIQMALYRHAVPFGSAIRANLISGTDDTHIKYQKFFYDNFEYAVVENALKWRQMEWNLGEINFDLPNKAIDALLQHGVSVRGHCVFWEVEKFVPEWLKNMTASGIRAQISRRADYVVKAFKGRLAHWDVNNEDLHGIFFKNRTGDTNIYQKMFQEVHSHDVDSKLFLNEYNVVKEGSMTNAYLNQANRMKASGVPIHGVGVQSHLAGNIDPSILQKRLDVVASSGLPIWVTELDYPSANHTVRAEAYEIALRLLYSNPSVEGIMIWGFWDGGHYNPDCSLVDGNDFVINEAGLRWQKLIKNEWHTQVTLQPASNTEEFSVRGFQGSYNITVLHQGNFLKTMQFDVPNRALSQRIQLYV